MKKEFKIKCLFKNEICISSVFVQPEWNGEVSLIFAGKNNAILSFTDAHLFTSFCKLRDVLLSEGAILLCKGCRRDVHPSGSQLKWIYAYHLKNGVRIKPDEDRVMIFDEEAEINTIATVEEQRLFYNDWLKSIATIPC